MHSARFFISVRSDRMRPDLASMAREPSLTPGPPAFLVASIQEGAGKNSPEILVHVDTAASHNYCRFVSSASMMTMSRLATAQSWSAGLRSGDCGG